MKCLGLLLALLYTLVCYGQDSLIVCKNRNLLIPQGTFDDRDSFSSKCENAEVIIEGQKFLITNFEKYGYILKIDTTENLISALVLAQVIGYCDLINNTDSVMILPHISWMSDNMAVYIVDRYKQPPLLKPGESVKLGYKILRGIRRISDYNMECSIIPPRTSHTEKDFIISTKEYIEKLGLYEMFKNSKSCFYMINRLEFDRKYRIKVDFRIPIRYINSIQYYAGFRPQKY